MAQRFYGETVSTAPGVTDVHLWSSDWDAHNDWLTEGFLRTAAAGEPWVWSQDEGKELQKVENHSWVGSFGNAADNIDALRRLDYAIDRDGFFAAVGVDNGSSETLPFLLCQSYNGISVGKTDGEHSHGVTVLDGAGRIKPEIVAPSVTTSRATARISSAAAMLLEHAGESEASNPQVIKAILLAGATKDEFGSNWDREPSRPLDEVYGAGELNVYRSYNILDAGEQPSSGSSLVSLQGWDFNRADDESRFYFFEVPGGHRLTEMSALLTWYRDVTDGAPGPLFDPRHSLENLNLGLYSARNFVLETELDSSLSSVDNLEHIYFNEELGIGDSLGPGRYALEVKASSPQADVAYGLAWFSNLQLLLGDMDLDGDVDFDDVDEFVLALNNPAVYQILYGVPPTLHGDTDGDGDHDFDDIEGLLEVLNVMTAPANLKTIPEPTTFVLAAIVSVLALFGWCWQRSRRRCA
jgi:hypothetical protein